jgi:hypothetical protein
MLVKSVLLFGVAIAGSIAVLVLMSRTQVVTDEQIPEEPPVVTAVPHPVATPSASLPVQPQRFPVAGAAGFFVVLNTDGSSSLEDPTGKVIKLADANTRTPETELAARLLANATGSRPDVKTTVGQLIVLEQGVVDVPKDALITFMDKDKLVVLAKDGTSTVYHVDGRVEPRERKPAAVPTATNTKGVGP